MYSKEWHKWLSSEDQKLKQDSKRFMFWHHNLYDLVIDTYQYSKEETFDIAHDVIKNGIKDKYVVSDEWRKKHLEK